MRGEDRANKPVAGVNLRDEERVLDCGPKDAQHAGYTRLARRPRSRLSTNIVCDERADKLESIYKDFGAGYGMDEY
jgi:hypothetical protein